jgi:hypothetical protein
LECQQRPFARVHVGSAPCKHGFRPRANPLPAGLRLNRKPRRPKRRPVISMVLGNHGHEKWKDFLDLAYWNVELEE